MTQSKLGPYCLTNHADWRKFVSAGACVVKSVNDLGLLAEAKRMNPQVTTVAIFTTGLQLRPGVNPQQLAVDWLREMGPRFAAGAGYVDYWETLNEPDMGDPAAATRWAQFTQAILLGVPAGIQLAIGSFSTGVPDLSFWRLPDVRDAILMAVQHQDVLALHEYSWPDMRWMTGAWQVNPNDTGALGANGKVEGWTTLRYRKVLSALGIPNLKILITETGVDPQVQPKPFDGGGAYRDLGDALDQWNGRHVDLDAEYARSLEWYDQELQKDSNVIGATVFTVGHADSKWEGFDIGGTGVVGHLCDYIRGAEKFQPYPEREVDPEPNLFTNPGFTSTQNGLDWYAGGKQEIKVPLFWQYWYNPDEKTVQPDHGDHYYPPELQMLYFEKASRKDQIAIFGWRKRVLKAFAGFKPFEGKFTQSLTLTKGRKYGLIVPVRPDFWESDGKGGVKFCANPDAFRVRLIYNGQYGEWLNGTAVPNGQYTKLRVEFVSDGLPHDFGLHTDCRWGLNENGFFFPEGAVLYVVQDTPAPAPAPVPPITPPVILPTPPPVVVPPVVPPPAPHVYDAQTVAAMLDDLGTRVRHLEETQASGGISK